MDEMTRRDSRSASPESSAMFGSPDCSAQLSSVLPAHPLAEMLGHHSQLSNEEEVFQESETGEKVLVTLFH